MVRADYRGARGSNAGDDFHELWAVRQALQLLDEGSGLSAITLEGLSPEDQAGAPAEAWDGVDCGLYYGASDSRSAKRVELAQLRYSSADPDKAWTIARLVATTNKKGNNSVVGRLAQAFAALPNAAAMAAAGRLSVRLVSNQPVATAVSAAVQTVPPPCAGGIWTPAAGSSAEALVAASGLDVTLFRSFASVFDLSECGQYSRFDLERRTLETIAGWVDDDVTVAVNAMVMLARRMMLPEAKGEIIRRETLLLSLDVADPAALFPCPSELQNVDRPVVRASSVETAMALRTAQRFCLHGTGGCGKTTALQEIRGMLPEHSEIIVFDCYGAGTYLDSDAYRHREHEAFLQLSNDLSATLRSPLLIARPGSVNLVRAFKKRLTRTAEIVATRSADAILVVALDAADNSVTAADLQTPPERSFIRDFVAIGDLPSNVRLVVTTRTGRLPSLHLPSSFVAREITGFTRTETGQFVHRQWPEAPSAWLDDFHHLSQGNPRVQQYALDLASGDPATAIRPLQPSGKGLDDVFRERLAFALKKGGGAQTLAEFCAALAGLPRPIPLAHLAAVAGLDEAQARDLCHDLAPGVRVAEGLVSFADEDFERFARDTGSAHHHRVAERTAMRLMAERGHDPYSAMHVAAALFAANRRSDLVALVREEPEPAALRDPVLRREAQLRRLRLAMRVARESGNTADAVLTLLIGAEALKTDSMIRSTFRENPDLAAMFARDTSARTILRDPEQLSHHGPLLMHMMAADARRGQAIPTRAGHRLVEAWLARRNEEAERQDQHPNIPKERWSISSSDIAAQVEAVLRVGGADRALKELRRWSPNHVPLEVVMQLAESLVTAGELGLVQDLAASPHAGSPWDLFLLVRLALGGAEIDVGRIAHAIQQLMRRRLVRFDKLADAWHDDGFAFTYHEALLTACELLVCRGGDRAIAEAALALFLPTNVRRRDQLSPSKVRIIDFGLRAYALTACLAGRVPTLEGFWLDPLPPAPDATEEQIQEAAASDKKKQEELQGLLGPLIGIYAARALSLVGGMPATDVDALFREALGRAKRTDYRFQRNHYAGAARRRAATSLARLLIQPEIAPEALFEWTVELMRGEREWLPPNDLTDLRGFAGVAATRSAFLSHVIRTADETAKARVAARDKVADLLTLARVAQPASPADAEALFTRAVSVADQTDYEILGALSLFAPLARRGTSARTQGNARRVAIDLAIASADASIRLDGHDAFPWDHVAVAHTTLDPVVAFAALARWEDEGTIGRAMLTPHILTAGLITGHLSPSAAVALTPLLDELPVDFVKAWAGSAAHGSTDPVGSMVETLAQDELLRFGEGKRETELPQVQWTVS